MGITSIFGHCYLVAIRTAAIGSHPSIGILGLTHVWSIHGPFHEISISSSFTSCRQQKHIIIDSQIIIPPSQQQQQQQHYHSFSQQHHHLSTNYQTIEYNKTKQTKNRYYRF